MSAPRGKADMVCLRGASQITEYTP